jgi:hypothetical protein
MARPDKTRQELTIEQLNAIDLLVTGQSDREVAEAVGVSRQTICGWRLYDPYFRAELNKRRKEIWGESVDRLRSMLPKALEVLERELDGGPNSWRAALKVIEMAGFSTAKGGYGTMGVGPDDPDEIINAEERERQITALQNAAWDLPEDHPGAVRAELQAKRKPSF